MVSDARGKGMENDWDAPRNERGWSAAGFGILRITLLFGSAAVALALILAPIADSQTRDYAVRDSIPFGVDDVTTGSINKSGSVYTIHKSVLQPSRDSVCVIHPGGKRVGDC